MNNEKKFILLVITLVVIILLIVGILSFFDAVTDIYSNPYNKCVDGCQSSESMAEVECIKSCNQMVNNIADELGVTIREIDWESLIKADACMQMEEFK